MNLLSGPTDFGNIIVKSYLIGPKNNDPNDILRTEHNNQKNGHEEDHLPITGSIAIHLILAIVVTPLITADLSINLADNYDFETVLLLLVRKNFN